MYTRRLQTLVDFYLHLLLQEPRNLPYYFHLSYPRPPQRGRPTYNAPHVTCSLSISFSKIEMRRLASVRRRGVVLVLLVVTTVHDLKTRAEVKIMQ